ASESLPVEVPVGPDPVAEWLTHGPEIARRGRRCSRCAMRREGVLGGGTAAFSEPACLSRRWVSAGKSPAARGFRSPVRLRRWLNLQLRPLQAAFQWLDAEDDVAVLEDADGPRRFADGDGNRLGSLRHRRSGPVAGAEAFAERQALSGCVEMPAGGHHDAV